MSKKSALTTVGIEPEISGDSIVKIGDSIVQKSGNPIGGTLN